MIIRETQMRSFVLLTVLLLSALANSPPAAAQEGHPLKGSWLGTWAGNTSHSQDVVLVLNWDGKAITGTINPGTDNIAVKNATLNPDGWLVHLEGDAKDASGRALTYVIDGKIENLHVPNRSITGTWKNQKESGAFKISRQ
jgi:mRNA-degrading endonuclease YafQ of YafQ-DinJ toxin-antitoxin module